MTASQATQGKANASLKEEEVVPVKIKAALVLQAVPQKKAAKEALQEAQSVHFLQKKKVAVSMKNQVDLQSEPAMILKNALLAESVQRNALLVAIVPEHALQEVKDQPSVPNAVKDPEDVLVDIKAVRMNIEKAAKM